MIIQSLSTHHHPKEKSCQVYSPQSIRMLQRYVVVKLKTCFLHHKTLVDFESAKLPSLLATTLPAAALMITWLGSEQCSNRPKKSPAVAVLSDISAGLHCRQMLLYWCTHSMLQQPISLLSCHQSVRSEQHSYWPSRPAATSALSLVFLCSQFCSHIVSWWREHHNSNESLC